MSPAGRAFDNTGLLGYLAEVDAELPAGEHVKIAVIGGAAITSLRPSRVTDDVDVISEGMPQELRDAAGAVASRHGLRSDWINDAAKTGLPRLDPLPPPRAPPNPSALLRRQTQPEPPQRPHSPPNTEAPDNQRRHARSSISCHPLVLATWHRLWSGRVGPPVVGSEVVSP